MCRRECPFCGSTRVKVYVTLSGRWNRKGVARCEECDCVLKSDEVDSRLDNATMIARQEAEAKWDTRFQRICHDEDERPDRFTCDVCGAQLDITDESGESTLYVNGFAHYPNYCPYCGAQIYD